MHKKTLTVLTVTLAALSLNGCFTLHQWQQFPLHERTSQCRELATDQLSAFGQIRKNNAALPAGSMIIAGEKYWYLIGPESAADLNTVLTTGLPKPWQLANSTGHAQDTLRITITDEKQKTFATEACLRYETADAKEIAKLQYLDFQEAGKNPKQDTDAWYCCMTFRGTLRGKEQNLPTEQSFRQRIPAILQIKTEIAEVHPENLLFNIAILPFTLLDDAIFMPVATLVVVGDALSVE
jgi:putative membrane protein